MMEKPSSNRQVCSLYARIVDNKSGKPGGSKLQELKRILRARCEDRKWETQFAKYEAVFKHKGTTSGEEMHASCELEPDQKQQSNFHMKDETFYLTNYSKPWPQSQHSCLVRGFESAKISSNFGCLLSFLGFSFAFEYVTQGILFKLGPSMEVRVYQTFKLVDGGYISSANADTMIVEPDAVWNRKNWWMVELRAVCEDRLKLPETEKYLAKFSELLQDYAEPQSFYANVARGR